MVVILFHIFKICIADKNICAGKNENVPVKTISSSKVNKHDHLECKEGYLSTFCISPGYNRDIGPWGYRHLTNISLPWIFTMEFYIYIYFSDNLHVVLLIFPTLKTFLLSVIAIKSFILRYFEPYHFKFMSRSKSLNDSLERLNSM